MRGCIQVKTAPGLCDQPAQQLDAGPSLAWELRHPGAPTHTMVLLEVQKQCLASKPCLPALCRSCLRLNACFKLCVAALGLGKPCVPGVQTACGWESRLRDELVSSARLRRGERPVLRHGNPSEEKQSSSRGVARLCPSH